MSHVRSIVCFALSLVSLPVFAQNHDSPDWQKELKSSTTLGTVRRLFLNHKVIVAGPVLDYDQVQAATGKTGRFLLEWHIPVKGSDGRYAFSGDLLSASYQGATATCVAVQLDEDMRRELKPNALGETVAENEITDPYFDLVVRFDDGTLAMLASYPTTLMSTVELASAASALAEVMSKQLPLLVGRSVYVVGNSKLYKPDTMLDEIIGIGPAQRAKGGLKQLWHGDIPLLQPSTVLATKYIPSTGVVLKLRLANGKEAIAFTPEMYYKGDDSKPFLERVIGELLLEVPKKLTPKEVDAIKQGTIYKGMSGTALFYLLGLPDKENDWGRGGKQWIFHDNTLLVYLDQDEKVEDWQVMDRR